MIGTKFFLLALASLGLTGTFNKVKRKIEAEDRASTTLLLPLTQRGRRDD